MIVLILLCCLMLFHHFAEAGFRSCKTCIHYILVNKATTQRFSRTRNKPNRKAGSTGFWHRLGQLSRITLLIGWLTTQRASGKPSAAQANGPTVVYGRAPKPPWVTEEVIRLKALMPHSGCRKIADTFNRLYRHSRHMTVGKTYIANTIKAHCYEIQVLRRQLKNRSPKPLPNDLIWAMDLTQVRDAENRAHAVFGITDAGSRACLLLRQVSSKASIVLLRCLLDTLEACQTKPKIIRTDNEPVFTSRLFRLTLRLLNIRHQTTEKCCPWMNGKIERLFGTLKEMLKHYVIQSQQTLTRDLAAFTSWYNFVRPHQYLDGKTPAEVWSQCSANPNGECYYFSQWQGALTGFYLPPT